MAQNNINWRVHRKRGPSGHYAMYENQLAMAAVHNGDLAISPRVWKELKEPERVLLLKEETGTMIGLRGASDGEFNAYKVIHPQGGSMLYISAKSFTSEHPALKGLTDSTKVWIGSMDGDTFVVNLLSRPSVVV